MIVENFPTFERAEQRAYELLRAQAPGEEIYTTYHELFEDVITVEAKYTKAYAVILMCKDRSGYFGVGVRMTYVEPGESFTYPYRNVRWGDDYFYYLCDIARLDRCIKPTKPIEAADTVTAAGEEWLRHYFGEGYTLYTLNRDLLEQAQRGENNVFYATEWSAGTYTYVRYHGAGEYYATKHVFPSLLSSVTGLPVGNLEEHYQALGALIGRRLTDKERSLQRQTYLNAQVGLFALYCRYCFLYEEKYTAIAEAQKNYWVFGIPEDAAASFMKPVERYVLKHYYSDKETPFCTYPTKEIADYIEADEELLTINEPPKLNPFKI